LSGASLYAFAIPASELLATNRFLGLALTHLTQKARKPLQTTKARPAQDTPSNLASIPHATDVRNGNRHICQLRTQKDFHAPTNMTTHICTTWRTIIPCAQIGANPLTSGGHTQRCSERNMRSSQKAPLTA
jgi:hypothetical protein